MVYRKIEKLGIQTSLLGFGCMRFPMDKEGKIDEKRSLEMIDTAYQAGVNYFDTAYVYHNGDSEIFTGKALDRYDRSSYYLATKLPIWLVKKAEDVERLLDEQLKKLNKDYIDFYLIHALNKERFDTVLELGVLDELDRLKAEGKIKNVGFSFHDGYDSFERIITYRDWDFCQIQLNYMDTEEQAGLKGYELTEKLGIPLVIMEPIKGGSLAKLPESSQQYLNALDTQKSTASWALRWVASLPNVKVILSGMSDEKQVADNLDTLGNFKKLTEEELAAIKNAAEALRSRVKNGCTGCAYCMPCPAGVDIPQNFRIWNGYGMYENAGEVKWAWNQGMGDAAKAKNCVECGQCEDACPQKISIREDLKKLQVEIDEVCAKLA